MKSLDANIIIRFLVNDDKKQGEKVRALFLEAEKRGSVFFVTSPVFLEVIYVLDSVYGFRRGEILDAIGSLSSMPIIRFEDTDAVQKFTTEGKNTTVDLEDIFIGLTAREAGCESTITFDKKAAKSDLFELLE